VKTLASTLGIKRRGLAAADEIKHQGAKNVSILSRPRIAVAAFALLIAAPAFAQQAAPAAPAPAAPAPAEAAPAAPTPSHVAVARDVIVASGIARTFDTMVAQALEQYKATVVQSQPQLRAETEAAVLEVLFKTRENEVKTMLISASILLARRMSEPELKDTLAFFSSASGKKYVETQPKFLDDLVPAIDSWASKALPSAAEQVRAILVAKGHKL
jgi:hypothetical protein